jgi:hypothetical protein
VYVEVLPVYLIGIDVKSLTLIVYVGLFPSRGKFGTCKLATDFRTFTARDLQVELRETNK